MGKRRIKLGGTFKIPSGKKIKIFEDYDDVFLLDRKQIDKLSPQDKKEAMFWSFLAIESIQEDKPIREPDRTKLNSDEIEYAGEMNASMLEPYGKAHYVVGFC